MNSLQVFNSQQFGRVRVVVSDGKPLFMANDVAKALGYVNPRDAIYKHCKGVAKRDTLTERGTQSASYIPESDVYRLVMRSKLPQAEQFQDWVCEDVLPSIRANGIYATPVTVDRMIADPDFAIKLLTNIKEERAKRLEAEKKVQTLIPKAELMDRVLDTDQKIDVGQAAKILNLPFGRNTLFQKLREKGVFFINRNEPKQEYINRGYFELKEKFIERNNHDGFTVIKVLVTQKGLDFIAKLFEVVPSVKRQASIR